MKNSFITSGPDLAINILLAPFGIMTYFQHINFLTLCMLCVFSCFCCRLLTYFKIFFFQIILSGTLSECQNGLDPDQD